jgi:hypothetical protein
MPTAALCNDNLRKLQLPQQTEPLNYGYAAVPMAAVPTTFGTSNIKPQ